MAKYGALTAELAAAAARGQQTIAMSFGRVEEIIGGPLPSSSDQRQWWANNSQVQALAWREADFHVEKVDLDRKQVTFARAPVGGTYADRGRRPGRQKDTHNSDASAGAPVGDPIDVRVVVQWRDGGTVALDAQDKPVFGDLPVKPGLYRMTLVGGLAGGPRVYVGESDNIRRRLSGNYRSPGPSQATSRRINALLREHLGCGGEVSVAIATDVSLWLGEEVQPLALDRKAGRLLAESAALVVAQLEGDAEIVNLG